MASVLDASAFLAYMLDEPGADLVEQAITEGAVLSAVNLAESLSRLADVRPDLAGGFSRIAGGMGADMSPHSLPSLDAGAPVLPQQVTVEPYTLPDAVLCAALRPGTRGKGLSLGDRACIALGRRLGVPVLTADRSWLEFEPDALGAEIRPIRP